MTIWTDEAARKVLGPIVVAVNALGIPPDKFAQFLADEYVDRHGVTIEPRELEVTEQVRAKATQPIPTWPEWVEPAQRNMLGLLCKQTKVPVTEVMNYVSGGEGEQEQRKRMEASARKLRKRLAEAAEQPGQKPAQRKMVPDEGLWQVYHPGGNYKKEGYLKCAGCTNYFGPSGSFRGDFEQWLNIKRKQADEQGWPGPLCWQCAKHQKKNAAAGRD